MSVTELQNISTMLATVVHHSSIHHPKICSFATEHHMIAEWNNTFDHLGWGGGGAYNSLEPGGR